MDNYTETTLRCAGMRVLIDKFGHVNAEKFISLISREPFDYTEWQRNLFDNMSVEELSHFAMSNYDSEKATKLPE